MAVTAIKQLQESSHHDQQQQRYGFEGDLVVGVQQVIEHYGIDEVTKLCDAGIFNIDFSGDDVDRNTTLEIGSHTLYNRWPAREVTDNRALVSYMFDPLFDGDKTVIEKSLRMIEDRTGVLKFAENAKQPPYIRISSQPVEHVASLETYLESVFPNITAGYRYPCWSYVGYQQIIEQGLNLGSGCITMGIVQHTFLHALGLWHESNRIDRDDNIEIQGDNIWPGLEYDFTKRIVHDTLGTPYDYASIMHNNPHDFSSSTSSCTFLSPEPPASTQRAALSDGDILKLRLLYQCNGGPRTWTEFKEYPCTSDCTCWEGAVGCNTDDECQGELICNSNKCVSLKHTSVSSVVVSATAGICCGLVILGWILFLLMKRRCNGYRALP